MEGTVTAMETLLSLVSDIFTLMGTTVTTITSNEILMIGLAIWLAGAGIGLAKRMIGHG